MHSAFVEYTIDRYNYSNVNTTKETKVTKMIECKNCQYESYFSETDI